MYRPVSSGATIHIAAISIIDWCSKVYVPSSWTVMYCCAKTPSTTKVRNSTTLPCSKVPKLLFVKRAAFDKSALSSTSEKYLVLDTVILINRGRRDSKKMKSDDQIVKSDSIIQLGCQNIKVRLPIIRFR